MSQPLVTAETRNASPISSGQISPAAREVAHLNAVLDAARSEQRHAESEKLRLAERLQALMDALPAAVLVIDGRGRVQEANPAAETLLQTPLRGRLWRELIGELFLPEGGNEDALALRNGRLVTLSTRPLGSEPGQVLMLQDVTDKQHLRSRLEHSRRLADMGRMAASLAHQIRTPLASALLYVSQLKSTRLDGPRRERFVGKAVASLKGLERLINDMLLFVNGGKGLRETLQPGALLESFAAELAAGSPEQGVTLQLEVDECPGSVQVNRVLMKSALQNLVTNAIQAGAGVVTLRSRCEAGQCRLEVCDNGPGITAEQQQNIFEPFVSERPGGTGLGLAVVRAVAQAMGGHVELRSQPGQGSEFSVCLPLYADEAPGTTDQQG